MPKIAKEMLDRYNWTPVEEEIIKTRFEEVLEKFWNMPEEVADKLFGYFDKWLMGECPKARLNYWMRKTGTTVEELNIYATY